LLPPLLGILSAGRDYAQLAGVGHDYHGATQDPLRGVTNRRPATAAIARLTMPPAGHHHQVRLDEIDISQRIHDARSHQGGDEVLLARARALQGSVRPGDITARLGGDEFLIFARNCDREGAEHIAQRLLATVRAVQKPEAFTVSVGCGITTGVQGGFDALYRQADAALYRAKNGGRDGYALPQPA